MKVVSCYRASKIAQVSKQCIARQKKINGSNKTKYKYFSYDKDTGKFGIDIESEEWIKYMEHRRITIGFNSTKENELTTRTDKEFTESDHRNNRSFTNLLIAVVAEIKKKYEPTEKELQKLTADISKRFKGMAN